MNINKRIQLLCLAHAQNNENMCKILMQNYVSNMKKRRKVFLKRLRIRLSVARKLFRQISTNNISNVLAIHYPKKRKTPKIWMKKRSSDWWDNIVNSENFDEWVENFRVDLATFRYLCNKLEPELRPDPFCVREPLAVDKKVAIALYKLASCAEYRVVGNQFGVHKTSVHRCIKQFCTAVIKVLLPEEIKMPTIEEAKILAAKFKEKSGISPIFGAIYGTHIPVTPPEEGYRDFINRKSWPSVILQGVVDANYSFIDITVKHPGCTHDAVVLKDSFLYQNITNYPMLSEIINGKEIKAFLIGDPAYPLQDWLMKGYVSASTQEEESFGVYLNKARIVVENAFGRLKSRWRILQKKIDADISLVPKIVATCCVLHNIAEKAKLPIQENWNVDLAETSILYPQPQNANSSQASSSANEIRDHIKNYMAQNYPLLRSKHF